MADNTTLPGTGDVISADDIASGVASGAKVQRIKNGFGADGSYSDVALDNGMPLTAGYKEFSGTAAANSVDIVSQDVSAYRWVTVQLTGTWSATVSFQFSNDNSTWLGVSSLTDRGSTTNSPLFSTTSNSIYSGPVLARYMRVRTTSYTSGTVNAVVGFSAQPLTPPTAYLGGSLSALPVSYSSGTFVVAGNNAGMGGDSFTNSTSAVPSIAGGYAWNGSSWDRVRTFGTLGSAGVTPTPGTTGGWSVSSQTALSSTKTQIKSSAGTVGGYMIFNSNTSVAYVQVWDVASGSITVGTTAPTYVLSIPAGSAANLELTCGVNHATAINVAATTTPTGSTAPTTALTCAFFYK